MVAGLALVMMASPVSADPAQVTRGSFTTFAMGGGLGYEISGKAQMVRTAAGSTIVAVNVAGLEPGNTYGSHVHNQPCAQGDAGGHYRFSSAGIAGAVDVDLGGVVRSEIWPGPFNANAAGHAVGWTQVDATAGSGAVSVVIHAPGGAKIACADLG